MVYHFQTPFKDAGFDQKNQNFRAIGHLSKWLKPKFQIILFERYSEIGTSQVQNIIFEIRFLSIKSINSWLIEMTKTLSFLKTMENIIEILFSL